MRLALFWVAVIASRAGIATAEPETTRVLVLGSQHRQGFVGALRIQVAGQAEIVTAEALPSGTVPERMAAAARRIAAGEARLAVWFDEAPSGEFVVYAVGARGDRGLIEVGRTPPGDSANADRILALKVSALLDDLLMAAPVAEVLSAPAEPAVEAPLPEPVETTLGAFAVAGATGSLSSRSPRSQAGATAGLGLAIDVGPWTGRAVVEGRWLAERRLVAETGTAELSELDVALVATAARRFGRLALGPSLEVGARRLHTAALTNDGETGSASSTIPTLALGLEASFALGRHLSVWASARARLNLILETVTIRGEPTVRVGRVSAPATAGVSFHWPL